MVSSRRGETKTTTTSSSSFAIALILASLSHRGSCVNTNIERHHNDAQQQQRQERQLPSSTHPFLPDYTTLTCKNDKAPQSWQINTSSPTATQCCTLNFSYDISTCTDNTVQWIMFSLSTPSPTPPSLLQQLNEVVEWYYDTSDGKCKINSNDRPTWLNSIHPTLRTCCNNESWDVSSCIMYGIDLLDGLTTGPTTDDGANDNNNVNGDDGTNNTSEEEEGKVSIINLTVRGSLTLNLPSIPSITNMDNASFTKLKITLIKTFISLFNDCNQWIYQADDDDGVNVQLWSLDGISFTWRRRRVFENENDEDDYDNHGGDYKVEELDVSSSSSSSSLRGNQPRAQKLQTHPRQLLTSTTSSTSYELIFELTLPSKCNIQCQSSTKVSLGSITPYQEINNYFITNINNGKFSILLYEIGIPMGLFIDDNNNKEEEEGEKFKWPSVSNGELNYHYALPSSSSSSYQDDSIITWMPSRKPTSSPTFITLTPTIDALYYPDMINNKCSTQSLSEYQVNTFNTLKECCNFHWMKPELNYEECISNSLNVNANHDNVDEDGSRPTNKPTKMPTLHPTIVNTSKPTTRSPVVPVVFYPDLTLGVCKFDGQHGTTPFTFTTAEECCNQDYIMIYEKCISYVSSIRTSYDTNILQCKYHPNPTNFGTCTYSAYYPITWDEWEKRTMLLFDTHESCCTNVFGTVGCDYEYDCDGRFDDDGPVDSYLISGDPPQGGGGPSTPQGGGPSTTNDDASLPPPPQHAPVPQGIITPKPTSDPTRNQEEEIVPPPTRSPTTSPMTTPILDVTSMPDGTMYQDSFENGLSSQLFPWQTSSSNPWTTITSDSTDGNTSAQSSSNLSSGETSDLYIIIHSNYGGTLHFDFKSDVKMPYSGCYINIDDESKSGYTYPIEEWIVDMTLDVPEGEHTVTFRAWAPNLMVPSGGSDVGVSGTIGVDNVRFVPKLGVK